MALCSRRLFCVRSLLLFEVQASSATTSFTTSKLLPARTRVVWCQRFSTSRAREGLSQRIVLGAQWANAKYEHFLQQRFPRFYRLYSTFLKGFRLLFQDAKEVRKIKARMYSNDTDHWNLPYRDMEKLRQFRRDMIKAVPLLLISIPPFANYVVFLLMYLFPRHFLIHQFWTPQQLAEFQTVYHSSRAQSHPPLLDALTQAVPTVEDDHLRSRLRQLCEKVQGGGHPLVSEVHALRSLFAGSGLGLESLCGGHRRQLCSLLFLTTHLPSSLLARRLHSHAVELMHLDKALAQLNPHLLSDAEIKQACYVRGVNAHSLTSSQCTEWLLQWLRFSLQLKESETSIYLHSMVLLTANYPELHHHHHHHHHQD
ncbi:LETM1 domain-containing protein 1 isoform X1 [Engraulis encrasicolus]|uniref:LETM1 domain-containing protein 1 isoform X1 n=1 Tax=Engraulis encrasicolus TaxID=184585 RepID=UPI002FD360C9